MPTVTPLACPVCAAPLDVAAGAAIVECRYCGRRAHVGWEAEAPNVRQAAAARSAPAVGIFVAGGLLSVAVATGIALAVASRHPTSGAATGVPAAPPPAVAPVAPPALATMPPVPTPPPAPVVTPAPAPTPARKSGPPPKREWDRSEARAALDRARTRLETSCRSSSGTRVQLEVFVTFGGDGVPSTIHAPNPGWRGSPELACVEGGLRLARIPPFTGAADSIYVGFSLH